MKILRALLLLLLWVGLAEAAPLRHHDLAVRLVPDRGGLEVEDRITLPTRAGSAIGFALHEGLQPTTDTPGASVRRVRSAAAAGISETPGFPVPIEWFRVELPAGAEQLHLKYGGVIRHPLSAEETYARGFRQTPGTISPDGVFLAAATVWVPWFGPDNVTFALAAELPPGWDAVSQGVREAHEVAATGARAVWRDDTPQEEIFLVASRFREYGGAAGSITTQVYLRRDDPALAAKYLEVGGQYLRMYASLLGPYAYPKFALVENFWETGYGMPSFSLLGPRVIRFPFILHSSYPHEILHNWWGNGVYVKWEEGNWCEGLTAYLADHLIREGRGQGAEYRQTTLQKYADYISGPGGRDFPLAEFRSRHSSASEAVGYGKSLMFYHMLRRELGDAAFIAGLRRFYAEFRFHAATFDDLQRALEEAAGRDLSIPFAQWVLRVGAPKLELGGVTRRREAAGWRLTATLRQTQRGEAFRMQVPMVITTEGGGVVQQQIWSDGKETEAELAVSNRPIHIDLDPEFDLFRWLDPRETPPALSGSFGAAKVAVVLPATAPPQLLAGYRQLAEGWARSEPGRWTILEDRELEELPAGAAVWVLGWENGWKQAALDTLAPYDTQVSGAGVRVENSELPAEGHSFVLVGRHPRDPNLTLTWIAAERPDPLPGLGRKLPHYHKYSYLGFQGAEPVNVLKGRWPAVGSPLSVPLEPGAERGALPARPPLAALPPAFSAERMGSDVEYLAAPERQGRGFGSVGLQQVARFIADQFRAIGLQSASDDGGYFQCWSARGGNPETEARLCNVVAVLPGTNAGLAGQSVVLGAHYDHLGLGWPDVRGDNLGQVHPGADDNASGVAVLLELARGLAVQRNLERAVVFAAFTGEEAGRLGSRYYVEHADAYPVSQVIGMVNLDTVGRLGDRKLLVLGTGTSREWVHIFRGASFVTGVPIETVASDVGGSDQASFVAAGVPAVQLFTGPHDDYHRPGDTADRVDRTGLARVAEVTREAVAYLARRPEPLTATLGKGGPAPEPTSASGRRAGLGTVPDFAFAGPGVRLDGVVPGSPAATAGLLGGDILLAVGREEIRDLADLSRVLKSAEPGQTLRLRYLRDGEPGEVAAVLARP